MILSAAVVSWAVLLMQPTDRNLSTLGEDIDALPTIVVDHDDFKITQSCKLLIPPGTVIEDDEGDGVLQINGDYLYIEFVEGSVLLGRAGIDEWLSQGAPQGEGWDTLTGTAITINAQEGVEIVGANIRGYRNGIVASDAPELMIRNATLSDLYRQRLGSTATREDSGDWLYPHHNDDNQWLENYGAAIWAERCHNAKFTGVKVRRGQNGIVLDSTNSATVSNNDCSFLSGWGLAMWRASQNIVSSNRFDFCVRGHVEGVYNRGQDSAGILMFEACTNNSIVSNSCTHGGDGIFGFGGNDAVKITTGKQWGNAGNTFTGNDLSFAPAHGLEMTFSEGNKVWTNLFESNAICGIWGGYSQGFNIEENKFILNGGMAYGRERGAINIEHGADNSITNNTFRNNKCGVRLWWDYDKSLLEQPGVAHRYKGVTNNTVKMNKFIFDRAHPFEQPSGDTPVMVGIELQDIGDAAEFSGPRVGENKVSNDLNIWEIAPEFAEELGIDPGSPKIMGFGSSIHNGHVRTRVPDRISPPGREWIIVDQWGPWDFESPTMREHSRSGSADIFELYPLVGSTPKISIDLEGVNAQVTPPKSGEGWRPWLLKISPRGNEPVSSYAGTVRIGDDWSRTISGRFINANWSVRCWAWTNDPLTDLDAWRAEADLVESVTLDQLDLPFASGGPSRVSQKLDIDNRDRFGLIAETEITLPKGKWKLSTLSDDGIRVFIHGETLLERWDIHGPTPDEVVFEVPDDSPTRIGIEYFENDGYAMLQVDLQPVD